MRITHEADYAIRILYYLSDKTAITGAKEIADKNGISLRFTLKILRKLILASIVKSFKGVNGGYLLLKPAEEISLGEVIEVIDGSIEINHCLSGEFDCTRVSNKTQCEIRGIFTIVNKKLRDELYEIKIGEIKNSLKQQQL